VNAREVVLDINVTDAKGNYVHGLTQDNFTVLEDGRPVPVRSFHERQPNQVQASATATAKPSLLPNTFSNAAEPEDVRPLNILMLDSLDTPIATQSIVQKYMLDFVEKMSAGTRVAVFSLSPTGQLSLVQGFTSDPELLKNALKSKKLNLGLPSLEDTGQDANVDIPSDMLQGQPTSKKQSGMVTPPKPTAYDQNVECNHAAERGQYTFSAMTEIAHYVYGMPGRKNLIWFSGAFPIRMNDKQGGVCFDFREDLQYADAMLWRSHTVLYPVDSRAMDIEAKNAPTSRIVRMQMAEHQTMQAVAEYTGGKPFLNTNDLAGAALQAVDSGANYYTITYTPTNQNNDTRLRIISIKADKPDLTLTYISGYYAVPPNTTLSGRPVEKKASPLETAMMRGALQPTEILFHVGVTSAASTDATLPPGNNPDPKTMKPPYRHLTLNYNIDLKGIQFESSPDGSYHGQFEYAVAVYNNGDGKTVNSSVMAAKPNVPLGVYQSMLDSGANVRQEIAVPAKGDYILRIGVHDLTTDHVGALEIPVSFIKP
jgi:VWFA-related protein